MKQKALKRPRRGGEASAGAPAPGLDPRSRRYSPEQRRAAVEAFERSGLTQREFARNFGVSVPSLGNWLKAFRARGARGLEHVGPGEPKRRGRRPMPKAKREAIEETKRRFPTFGIRKVSQFLGRFVGIKASPGTVRTTLRAAALHTPAVRPKRRPAPPREFVRAHPGELWQSDITYLHVPWSRRPLYLIAFMDDCSRYVVSVGLHLQQRQEIAIEALLLGISKFGRPKEVLTDQGRQYYSWRGKNDFQKLLDREGIRHVVARAHHPETVGKCERFWETIKSELWDRIAPKDLDDARARLHHFIGHYNHFRPHQALQGLTPADRFFGAQDAVRAAIEAVLDKNELLLALNEPPRHPVFLVGQIGEQSVSLHGERGRVVLQTEDGTRREISMEQMGMAKEEKEENRERSESKVDRTGAGADPAASGRVHGAAAASDAEGAQAHEDRGAGALPAARAGAVAGGERGGAEASALLRGDDPRGVARQDLARGGGGAAVDASASLLAALPAGGGGDGGRVLEAAPGAARAAGDAGQGSARGPEGASGTDPRAGDGSRGRANDDLDPSGAAGAPRGEPAGGDGRWTAERTSEGSDGRST